MQLFCKYGVDPSDPAIGFVFASYDDDKVPAGEPHPGCLLVPYSGDLDALEKFGPEPQKLGDPPTECFPTHAELDADCVPSDHRLRRVAGRQMPDNRQTEVDFRPRCAPPLTLDLARSVKLRELDAAYVTAHDAGFTSAALGEPHLYPSTAEAYAKLQMATFASLSGQSKPGWTARLTCGGADALPTSPPHTALQVHAVVADYQTFDDALHAKRDDLAARVAGAGTVAEVLALTWA